jgi:hypothetical protein
MAPLLHTGNFGHAVQATGALHAGHHAPALVALTFCRSLSWPR